MDLATLFRFPLDRPSGRPLVWVVLLSVVVLLVVALAAAAWAVAAPLDPDLTGSWRWWDSMRHLA